MVTTDNSNSQEESSSCVTKEEKVEDIPGKKLGK